MLQTWLCIPVSLCNREKLCFLQRFEPREAAEMQSIQTNLKVKSVQNLISYPETKNVSAPPQKNDIPISPFIVTPSTIKF